MDVPNINKMISTTNHFWANVAWLLLWWDVDWMSTSIDQEIRDNHKLLVNFQTDFKLRYFIFHKSGWYLREHLCCVLLHVEQFSPRIGTEIVQRLVDVDLLGDARGLILVLPGLHVHDGQARLQRGLEILQTKVDKVHVTYALCVVRSDM